MEDVIEQLLELAEVVPVPLELPEEEDLVEIEEELFLPIPFEMREYLLKVSHVVYGNLEPVTVADSHSHTYLPEVAAMAWSLGVSRELIPLCEARGGYYCVMRTKTKSGTRRKKSGLLSGIGSKKFGCKASGHLSQLLK